MAKRMTPETAADYVGDLLTGIYLDGYTGPLAFAEAERMIDEAEEFIISLEIEAPADVRADFELIRAALSGAQFAAENDRGQAASE